MTASYRFPRTSPSAPASSPSSATRPSAPPGAAPDGTFLLANARKSRAYFLLVARSGRFVPDDPRWHYEMAEVMAISMLPAMEKLSTQAALQRSLIQRKRRMAAAPTRATARGSQSPKKRNSPSPETKPPI